MNDIKKELSEINCPILKKASIKLGEKSLIGKRIEIKKINSRFGAVKKYYKPICKIF
jgi:hypothetical protein